MAAEPVPGKGREAARDRSAERLLPKANLLARVRTSERRRYSEIVTFYFIVVGQLLGNACGR